MEMDDEAKASEIPEIMLQDMDKRSIYVGNVDYSVTQEVLKDHFKECGEVVKVTIPHDQFKRPKGFGYLQFATEEGMRSALGLDNTLLAGRHIKVKPKRVNQPGMGSVTNRGSVGKRGRTVYVTRYVYIRGGRGGMDRRQQRRRDRYPRQFSP